MTEFFERVVIVGLGLIGGSIAKALKKNGYNGEICGYDADADTVRRALAQGCVNSTATSLAEAVVPGGLVVLAAPLDSYREIFRQIASCQPEKTLLLTDAGSVKTVVAAWAAELAPQFTFVGGHPMAGSERGGFWASTAHLFENAYYFLTPSAVDNEVQLRKLENFVRCLGAIPLQLSPQRHDRIVAAISHLPHVTAAALAGLFAGEERIKDTTFAGGGLRDTTRVAAGEPRLWLEILGHNRLPVVAELDMLIKRLGLLREALAAGDKAQLQQLLAEGKFVRDALPRHTRDYLPDIYNVFVPVADQPGIIAELTRLIGERRLNICEIEILHVRENTSGAIRIGFSNNVDAVAAQALLNNNGYEAECGRKDADDR